MSSGGSPRVLHICGDYPFTPLYHRLLVHLADAGAGDHTMYVPLARGRAFPDTYDLDLPHARVTYSHDFGKLERAFYGIRSARIARGIASRGLTTNLGLVHAHYLLSAGSVALRLKRAHSIPYVVSVRAGDVHLVLRKMPYLQPLARRIMEGAHTIAFLSPALRDFTLGAVPQSKARERLASRSVVMPNGIDPYWLSNPPALPRAPGDGTIRMLFVGEITANKNVEALVAIAREVAARGHAVHLDVVGSGAHEPVLRGASEQAAGLVTLRPWCRDQSALRTLYGQADVFAMLSRMETFGLVYVEALSQGAPILYTRGQGVSGYFKEGSVGFGCDPQAVTENADRVLHIVRQGDAMRRRCVDAAQRFAWPRIAAEWADIYRAAAPNEVDGQ